MCKALAVSLALSLSLTPVLTAAPRPLAGPALPSQDFGDDEYFSAEQLDNLLAPIALYPDPLLAQVLLAATFVDQVDEAARYVRARGQFGVDDGPWDVSVKAVAHYPLVLDYLADHLNWTTTVGQAYVAQSTDVMISVQRLRRMARSEGNLVTTPEQEVLLEDDYIRIVPAQPTLIYVPRYDPAFVYYHRPVSGLAIVFSLGLQIGAWLNDDCDWRGHRVYYHGWSGGGWIVRSRPHVRITTVYVSPRYSTVTINRRVMDRNVNYWALDRYNSIHRNVTYESVRSHRQRQSDSHPADSRGRSGNAVIDRNIDTRDPRLDHYRGREDRAQAAPRARAVPAPHEAERAPSPPPAARRQPTPRPAPHAYGKTKNGFDPSAASRRGKSSREASKAPPRAQRETAKPKAQDKAKPRGTPNRPKEKPKQR
jgi:Protein of unknown function (DUF3300)